MPQLHIQCYEEHTDAQKIVLVRDLTKTVCAAAVVTPPNVQIQFYPTSRNNRAVSGRLMSDVKDPDKLPLEDTPWLIIQLQLFQGRSLDQTRALAGCHRRHLQEFRHPSGTHPNHPLGDEQDPQFYRRPAGD